MPLVFNFSNLQAFKPSNFQTFKLSPSVLFKLSNISNFQTSNFQKVRQCNLDPFPVSPPLPSRPVRASAASRGPQPPWVQRVGGAPTPKVQTSLVRKPLPRASAPEYIREVCRAAPQASSGSLGGSAPWVYSGMFDQASFSTGQGGVRLPTGVKRRISNDL